MGRNVKKECNVNKITNGIRMLKRAVKHGFKANYVLVDSWFPSKDFIQSVRSMKQGMMHVVCAMRKDFRKYAYNGESKRKGTLENSEKRR